MNIETTPAPAGPRSEGIPQNGHSHTTPKHPPLPMRSCRIMAALVRHGNKTREEIDKIAPASNGPHYVGLIRKALGIEIHCQHVPFTTIDGVESWYGLYTATADERAVMREYLRARGMQI